jgi:hypothetical protein
MSLEPRRREPSVVRCQLEASDNSFVTALGYRAFRLSPEGERANVERKRGLRRPEPVFPVQELDAAIAFYGRLGSACAATTAVMDTHSGKA